MLRLIGGSTSRVSAARQAWGRGRASGRRRAHDTTPPATPGDATPPPSATTAILRHLQRRHEGGDAEERITTSDDAQTKNSRRCDEVGASSSANAIASRPRHPKRRAHRHKSGDATAAPTERRRKGEHERGSSGDDDGGAVAAGTAGVFSSSSPSPSMSTPRQHHLSAATDVRNSSGAGSAVSSPEHHSLHTLHARFKGARAIDDGLLRDAAAVFDATWRGVAQAEASRQVNAGAAGIANAAAGPRAPLPPPFLFTPDDAQRVIDTLRMIAKAGDAASGLDADGRLGAADEYGEHHRLRGAVFAAAAPLALARLEYLSPRYLSILVYACAKAGAAGDVGALFDGVAAAVCDATRTGRGRAPLKRFNSQDLSNAAWAYATARVEAAELRGAMARETVKRLAALAHPTKPQRHHHRPGAGPAAADESLSLHVVPIILWAFAAWRVRVEGGCAAGVLDGGRHLGSLGADARRPHAATTAASSSRAAGGPAKQDKKSSRHAAVNDTNAAHELYTTAAEALLAEGSSAYLQEMPPKELANVVWAYATAQCVVGGARGRGEGVTSNPSRRDGNGKGGAESGTTSAVAEAEVATAAAAAAAAAAHDQWVENLLSEAAQTGSQRQSDSEQPKEGRSWLDSMHTRGSGKDPDDAARAAAAAAAAAMQDPWAKTTAPETWQERQGANNDPHPTGSSTEASSTNNDSTEFDLAPGVADGAAGALHDEWVGAMWEEADAGRGARSWTDVGTSSVKEGRVTRDAALKGGGEAVAAAATTTHNPCDTAIVPTTGRGRRERGSGGAHEFTIEWDGAPEASDADGAVVSGEIFEERRYQPDAIARLLSAAAAATEQQIHRFPPQAVANTLWGLAKARVVDTSGTDGAGGGVFSACADGVLRSAAGTQGFQGYTSQHIATTLWALATAACGHPALLDAFAMAVAGRERAWVQQQQQQQQQQQLLTTAPTLFDRPQALANVVWAYATLRHTTAAVDDMLAALGASVRAGGPSAMPILAGRHAANVVWGLARLEVVDHALFRVIVGQAVRGCDLAAGGVDAAAPAAAAAGDTVGKADTLPPPRGPSSSSSYRPRDLARVLWACVRAEHPAHELFAAVAVMVCRAGEASSDGTSNSRSVPADGGQHNGSGEVVKEEKKKKKKEKSRMGGSNNSLSAFDPQTTATLLWTFATAQQPAPAVFATTAPHIAACIDTYRPQHVSMVAWAYATVQRRDPVVFQAVAGRARGCLSAMTAQGVTNTVWAFATAGYASTGRPADAADADPEVDAAALFNAVAAWVVQHGGGLRGGVRVDGDYGDASGGGGDPSSSSVERDAVLLDPHAQHLPGFTPRLLANLVWSYATAAHSAPGLLDAVAAAVAGLVRGGADDDGGWAPMFTTPAPGAARDPCRNAAADAYIPDATPQNLASLVWAYATLRGGHPQIFDAVALPGSLEVLARDGVAQDLALVAWSLAKVKHTAPAVFDAIAHAAPRALALDDTTVQNHVNLVWAFATAQHHAPQLFDAVAASLVPRLREASPQHLANAVWAYAKAHHSAPALFDAVAAAAPAVTEGFTQQHLSSMVWAYTTVRHQERDFMRRV